MATRRKFLAGTGALALASLTPGRLLAALEQSAAPPARLSDWAGVRAQFALAPGYLHFSSFFIVSHPRPVRQAIEDFRRALDANPYLMVERSMFETLAGNLEARVREQMAPYLGARPEDIALTGNTTMGLALVYAGLPLRAGDEVLTTTQDHYSHHESIRFAVERARATMRKVALYDPAATATVGAIVERLRRAIQPATRVVGLTWVHSSTGMRLPIRALAEVIDEANRHRAERDRIVLVVDGVHGLGAVDEEVAGLGCDFFCAGTHKWMFAPRGTGMVWGKSEGWGRLRPVIPNFSNLEAFKAWLEDTPPPAVDATVMTPGGFHAYEHRWAVGAAFRFHLAIGRARVAQRIRQLNDQLKEGLAAMRGVRLVTPRDPELSAGLVAFEVEGVTPEDVVKRLLERRIVASTSPYRVTYARLAPSLVNTPAEVETALREVHALARA
jgi:selenocysteine lyase/cysteine desulfurase